MGGGGDSAQSLKEGTARVPRRRKAKPLAWGPIINLSFAPPVTPSRVSPGRRTRVQRSADHLAVPRLERRWREERAGLGPCVLQECRLRRAPDPSPAATYLAHAGTAAAAPPRLGRARPGAWRCARAATAQGPAPAPPPLVRSPSPAPLDPTALSPREPRTPRAPPGPPPQPAPGPAPTDPCSPPAPPRPPPEPTRVLLAAPPLVLPSLGSSEARPSAASALQGCLRAGPESTGSRSRAVGTSRGSARMAAAGPPGPQGRWVKSSRPLSRCGRTRVAAEGG